MEHASKIYFRSHSNLLTNALRKVVESESALITELSIIVDFAGAASSGDITQTVFSAIEVTHAWDAVWVAVVTSVTSERN